MITELILCSDNIEANISSAERSTAKGVTELRSAAGYLDSARTKMCCIIVVILIIVGIVVGALVLGTLSNNSYSLWLSNPSVYARYFIWLEQVTCSRNRTRLERVLLGGALFYLS